MSNRVSCSIGEWWTQRQACGAPTYSITGEAPDAESYYCIPDVNGWAKFAVFSMFRKLLK